MIVYNILLCNMHITEYLDEDPGVCNFSLYYTLFIAIWYKVNAFIGQKKIFFLKN